MLRVASADPLTSRRHLKPRFGYLEHVEIDYEPRCDNGPVPERFAQWWNYLKQATAGEKPIEFPRNAVSLLRSQGFVDVTEEIIRLPMSGDITEDSAGSLGRWHQLCLTQSIEALCLAPFARCFRWDVEKDIKPFVREVDQMIRMKKWQLYNNLHIVSARRP
jgi:hypothetical protein